MSEFRQYLIFAGAIFLLALPAFGALALYKFTNNPYFRPLGISKDAVAAVDGQTSAVSIEIQVRWGINSRSSLSKVELRELISDTFSTRTDAFHFDISEVEGDNVRVTFIVGPNRYGPYPPGRMVDGIIPRVLQNDSAMDFGYRLRC